jgi:hypothetical protein
MKRPLSLVLAAALAASTMAISVGPAAAQGVGVTFGVGGWDNDRWHGDDGWRYRHYRHRDDFAPGFSFSIGTPYPYSRAYYHPRHYYRDRDCWRQWDGEIVCRY